MKNDKYPIKVAAVHRLDRGESKSSICKELHVDHRSLHLWYSIYKLGGELSLMRTADEPKKTQQEKINIVSDIINNNLTLLTASSKYLLPENTIKRWLKQYRENGEFGLERKNKSMEKKAYTQEQLDELDVLRKRNEYLEAENALLKKVRALVEEREARLRAIGQKPSKN